MGRIFAEGNVACQNCMWWHANEEDDDNWGECHNVSQNDYSNAMIVADDGVLLTNATHFCGDFQAGSDVNT
jgi:hypothetical protein